MAVGAEATAGTDAALDGIKVLDVAGTIATGYCGKLFADHGADVINVEPPGGFGTRREPPFVPGVDAPENGALHAYLSTNKASVVLDAKARPVELKGLARGAQVVLDDGSFDTADFADVAPEVVVSTITWFGRTGPYAEFEAAPVRCAGRSPALSATWVRPRVRRSSPPVAARRSSAA